MRTKRFCGLALLGLMWFFSFPALGQPSLKNKKTYSAFQKPIFSYLGMEGPAVRRLNNRRLDIIEKAIRSAVEKGRFIFVKLPFRSVAEGKYVEKMVKLVAARSMGIARMRSVWDNEFQGYAVTTEMLEGVQNKSFYYWIELLRVKRYYNRALGRHQYIMAAKLHIRRMVIFPCTQANRQKSRRHLAACRRKNDEDYAGFAKPYKIIKSRVDNPGLSSSMFRVLGGALGVNTSNRRNVFRNTAVYLGRTLFKEMAKVKDFALHAPVMRATFNQVYTVLGKSEGVEVNQGYKVFVRRTNGKFRYRGYVRVREIGDNRMTFKDGKKVRVNPDAPYLTRAQILSVSNGTTLQKGMLLFEHPLLGISIGASLGLAPLTLTGLRGGTDLGFPFPIFGGTVLAMNVRLNTEFDLSHATKIPEFYLNIAVDLGLVGGGSLYGFVMPILPSIGILKKFYFRNLGFTFGVRGIAGFLYADVSAFMVGGEGIVGLDIFIIPEFTLTIRAGFRAATTLDTSILSIGPWFMLGGNYTF